MGQPKKTDGTKVSAEQAIQAIQEAGGNISAAARALTISRNTLHRYINEKTTIREALEEARESLIDTAENELANQIKSGNMTAIIFFLKTQGKSRGYVERQEVTGADGGPLPIAIINASEEDLDAI